MPPMMFFARARIFLTRIFAGCLIVVILLSGSAWHERSAPLANLLFVAGLFLASVGTLGRSWCSCYIAGYKNRKLITEGPYSICRNPLYFFSLVGAVGIGLATETLTIPLLIAVSFALYYPMVIKSEERQLLEMYGEQYTEYVRRVPSFFPRFSNLRESRESVLYPIILRKHLINAFWFIWCICLLELVEGMHQVGWLPVLWKIY